MEKNRLDPKIFKLDSRIKDGYYSDKYFCRTKEILEKDNHHPKVLMQIFQRNDNVCLCGIDEAIAIIKESLGDKFRNLEIKALHDGNIANAWETVMTIKGDYSLFAHLETVYLGALARGTKIATNVYRCFKAANGKPILFFPARFDSHLIQAKDGYSYNIGRKAAGFEGGGISTDAQGEWWGNEGLGTIPHGLIAAYGGDTVKATLRFAELMPKNIKRIALVDFDNDCVNTAWEVAEAMWERYYRGECEMDDRFRLYGVRLDTSGNMVDKSIAEDMEDNEYLGDFKPTGVNAKLVKDVRDALNRLRMLKNSQYFFNIKIIVSGGFDSRKILDFEKNKIPADAYGVGSSLFNGNFDFTADVVQILEGDKWIHCAKKGRRFRENEKLK